jgi:hypothetical protein
MLTPATQPTHAPLAEQGAQFDRRAKPKEFRSICSLFHYFTILGGVFLALRFDITTGGGAGGRSSTCIWIAKRSLPIWAMIVCIPGSSSRFGR